jgi:hypothetical protein
VHELEGEVSTLKAHLDQLLEMPGGTQTKPAVVEPLPVETKPETPSVVAEPLPLNGEEPSTQKAS